MDPQKNNNLQPTNNKNSEKEVDYVSFLESDNYFAFIYKKTEKLATATYMVTNLFSDNEPMKWTLRKKVSEMLSFILGYKSSTSQQGTFLGDVKDRVLDIISLLEVLCKSGLVSVMNFSILRDEFLVLINILDESKLTAENSSNVTMPRSFFEVKHDSSPVISGRGQIGPAGLPDTSLKDKISGNGNQAIFKRTNRQNIILGLLKKKKEMSIKDIAETIKDCSEKTIQRELISLIRDGIIKKTGERRWSRYSLTI